MISLINKENNKPIIDELSEVLFILVTKISGHNSQNFGEKSQNQDTILDLLLQ